MTTAAKIRVISHAFAGRTYYKVVLWDGAATSIEGTYPSQKQAMRRAEMLARHHNAKLQRKVAND